MIVWAGTESFSMCLLCSSNVNVKVIPTHGSSQVALLIFVTCYSGTVLGKPKYWAQSTEQSSKKYSFQEIPKLERFDLWAEPIAIGQGVIVLT